MDFALEDRDAGTEDEKRDHHLPDREGHWVDVDIGPFHVHRTGRPADGGAEREQKSCRHAGRGQRIDQDGHADAAQSQRQGAGTREPLAEHNARHQTCPNRHGVNEHGDAPRRRKQLCECDAHAEDHHIKAGDDKDVHPGCAVFNAQGMPLQPCERVERNPTDRQARDPHAERWDVAQRDFHRWPREPPGEAQHDKHQLCLCVVRLAFHPAPVWISEGGSGDDNTRLPFTLGVPSSAGVITAAARIVKRALDNGCALRACLPVSADATDSPISLLLLHRR